MKTAKLTVMVMALTMIARIATAQVAAPRTKETRSTSDTIKTAAPVRGTVPNLDRRDSIVRNNPANRRTETGNTGRKRDTLKTDSPVIRRNVIPPARKKTP